MNLSCSFAHKGQLLQTSSHTHPASPRNTFNAKANCPCSLSVWEVGFFVRVGEDSHEPRLNLTRLFYSSHLGAFRASISASAPREAVEIVHTCSCQERSASLLAYLLRPYFLVDFNLVVSFSLVSF